LPPRGEELVAPPTQQQGLGAQRLVELDRVELFAILDLADPAADPEALFTVRVLDDSVERNELADDDLSHFGSPSLVLSATTDVETATLGKWAPTNRSVHSSAGVYTREKCGEPREEGDARVVTGDVMSRARTGDGDAFRELTEPHRQELLVHCYRMLGSLQDAEDALQDSLLAAG
jgi:hypothetical protein